MAKWQHRNLYLLLLKTTYITAPVAAKPRAAVTGFATSAVMQAPQMLPVNPPAPTPDT